MDPRPRNRDVREILGSRVLSGWVHGFTTRLGGVSHGAYESMNLGRAVDDTPEAVEENLARVAWVAGYDPTRLFASHQVHGSDVLYVQGGEDPVHLRSQRADVLVTDAPGAVVSVRVADCAPVLLGVEGGRGVAAIHAGWRGVVAGAVGAGVDALARLSGTDRTHVRAAIGPSIGPCCFEVGEDVAERIASVSDDTVVRAPGGGVRKPHVDLAAAISIQLERAGLSAAGIERVEGCTRCEPDRFFSYRRDGAQSGRHLGFIEAPNP